MANLSQQKRQRMLEFINKIREEHKDDDEMLIVLGEIENELNSKKYGLVWEEHSEEVEEQMKSKIPVFTEDKNMEIVSDETMPFNFLLEGDNLHSLKLLEKTHKGKIDVIYIDPPYNTESKDFVYDDRKIGSDDTYRHSMWISFMNRRLQIAKRLLVEQGVIFISIDNNEYANLKLLCDQIFGENNFVTTIHVELSATQGMKVKAAKMGNVVKNGEYILVYSKDGHKNIAINTLYDHRPDYDNHYIKYLAETNNVENLKDVFNDRYPNDKISSVVDAYQNNKKFKRFVEENLDRIFRYDKTTGFNPEDFEFGKVTTLFKNGRKYVLQRKTNSVEQLMFLSDSYGQCNDFKESYGLRKIRGDWWKEFYLDMGNVSKEGNVVFTNGKKPVRLIQQLIHMVTSRNETILDFFAGSGTTGHAVLKLNQEDGGNRKFILCTNNENNICEEITYERVKRVINGYGDVDGIPANLKYYRTDFVSKESEDVSDELLKHIKEMIQLEHGIQVDGSKYLILLTDEDADELELKWDEYSEIKALYVSRNVLFTSKQNVLFTNVEIHIIPDDYFKFELQEVGEAW